MLLDPAARPLIAHRGASGQFPENTLLAFAEGLAAGADGLEFDVRLSSDGVPVVIHDATLERTTTGVGTVAQYTAAQLAAFDAGRGERIPTLDQVLESFPDVPLIVEVKEARAGVVTATALERHGAAGRTLVGSFSEVALRPFRRPQFHRAASRPEIALFWLGTRLGWAPRSGTFAAFAIPEYHRRIHVVDGALVRGATRRRRPVHVWTVNERADAERLRALGVAGILTDFPARLRGLAESEPVGATRREPDD